MWRTRAVLTLLHEEVAGLAREDTDDEAEHPGLERARRRARLVVAFDWVALVVLLAFSDPGLPLLSLGPSEQTAFTLAVLAVAVHSGFRLGQLEKLSAVARAVADLTRRDPAP